MATIVAINASLSYYKNIKFNIPLIICTVIPVWFMLTFREYHIGNDTIGYVNVFNILCKSSWNEVFNYSSKDEPGLFIFMKLISYISNNPTFLFGVLYLVFLSIIIYFFYNNCKKPLIPFFLWTTLGGFDFFITGIRQAFAICICLIAYEFMKKKNIIFFILFVFLAIQFHKSAYLFFPVCFLYFVKNNKATYILWVISALIIPFSIFFFQILINNFLYSDLSLSYTALEYTNNGYLMISYFTIMIILSMNRRKYLVTNIQENMQYNTSVIAWIFWIGRAFTRVAERPGMYFMYPFYCTIGNLVLLYNGKYSIAVRLSILVFPLLLFVYRIQNFSYHFIFE